MANHETEKYLLGQAIDIRQKTSLENLTPAQQKMLGSAISLYLSYCKAATNHDPDSRIESGDIPSIYKINILPELSSIYQLLSRAEEREEEEKEQRKPVKEDSTVPAELETLVALYKEEQADQLDADTNHSVADAIKRARKAWAIKHQADLIRENRLALIQDKTEREKQKEIENLDRDLFFIKNINPKVESAHILTQNIERVSRQAIVTQASNQKIVLTESQIDQASRELKELGLWGVVDFNTDFKNLNVLSQLVLRNQGAIINSPINQIDDKVKAWQEANSKERFTDKPEEIDKEINSSDEKSQEYFNATAENLAYQLKKKNPDILDNVEEASKEIEDIQTKLLKAIPDAALPSANPTRLHQNIQTLEKSLRQSDSSILINPEGLGARTIAVLQTTNSQDRNLSPEVLRLYSLGLSPEKLNKILADPKSPLSLYFQSPEGKSVYQQVHFQLGKIHNSKLGEEIRGGLKVSTGLSGNINSFYNRLPPSVQTVTKLVLNPKGTVYAWVNKKIGQRIGNLMIKRFGSATAKKMGGFILKHGLKEGVKQFVGAAAKQLMIAAAKQAGVQGAKIAGMVAAESAIAAAAVALGISTFGLSLIIGAILMVGTVVVDVTIGIVKKGLDKVWQELGWGEKFRMRDLIKPLLILGAAVIATGAIAYGGFIFIVRTAQLAMVSAVGIIIVAVVTMGLFLGMTYLVAPMLSTLVQLDSVEKVDYSQYGPIATPSDDCAWPTKGHYSINTGPLGGTHYKNHLEAIDIGAPGGSPLLSATSGIVSFTGVYSNYGNTIQIQTKNSAGSFVVFYGHLSAIFVGVGQQVSQGKPIGIVGGSGGWSPHIHMEYKGIKYNQCPAGGLKIKEGCCTYSPSPACSGACNAFSN